MRIDDCRLTIDGWVLGVAVHPGRYSSSVSLQSLIAPWLRGFVASCFLLMASWAALADEPRDLIRQGNGHFAAERYAEALEAYEQVGDEADERIVAELLHNRAAAHFKLGQFDDARELWVRAASLKDAPFEATARYNLGNCDYADALKALEAQDAGSALELLDRALQQYQDALRLDPERLDARANLELAALLKEQIEEQAQQQPQSQPSSEQDQDGEQQDESSSQPSSQPSQSDQQDQDQSESESQQQDQQSEEGDEQEQQDQSQQATSQPDSQPTPESQPSEQPASEAGEEEEQQVVPIEMTKEEAERLLQMIRDAERQRRAILRAREAAGYEPVDKDW